MMLLSVLYRHTETIRVPTCGGMDSEVSGARVTESVARFVVPADNAHWRMVATGELISHHRHDANFEVVKIADGERVNAILHPPTYKL